MILIPKVETESRFDRDVAHWTAFQSLLDRADRDGLRSFGIDEAERFHTLHRVITTQLAQTRSLGVDLKREAYLESLAKRGYNHLYPSGHRPLHEVLILLKGGFARSFRETRRLQIASWVFFLAGVWLGFVSTQSEPEYAYPLVGMMYPAEFVQALIESESERVAFLRSGRGMGTGSQTIFFTALFLNNTRAAFGAFAFGVLACIPTVLILVLNGALLGSFAALFNGPGLNSEFWAWILPHAIPEVLAVCVAASGGLRLGMALIDPADKSRREALANAGRGSATLLGLSMCLLLYAALIEAFIRQSELSLSFRYVLAFLNFSAIVVYLSFAGLRSSDGDRLFRNELRLHPARNKGRSNKTQGT